MMMFREFRARHRLTQAQLGAMLDMSSTQVARVERGERKTRRVNLLLLERLDRELSEARIGETDA